MICLKEMQEHKVLHRKLIKYWVTREPLKTGVNNVLLVRSVIFCVANVTFNDEWETETTKNTKNTTNK